VVMLKVKAVPTAAVAETALLRVGLWSTVSVNDCEVVPALLVAVRVTA